jgi:hypothetical protein
MMRFERKQQKMLAGEWHKIICNCICIPFNLLFISCFSYIYNYKLLIVYRTDRNLLSYHTSLPTVNQNWVEKQFFILFTYLTMETQREH